jgi:uncharacterized alkaline shock family protein YloU
MDETPHPAAEAQNGEVTIADSVVAKVAHNACREIQGVHALGGAASRAFSSLRGESRTQGVSVDIHEGGVDLDITMVATYGFNIAEVADQCREAVRVAVQGMTGMQVRQVNVVVADIHFPDDPDSEDPQA